MENAIPISLMHPAISLSGWNGLSVWLVGSACVLSHQCHEGIAVVFLLALLLLTGLLRATRHAHARVKIHTGHIVALLPSLIRMQVVGASSVSVCRVKVLRDRRGGVNKQPALAGQTSCQAFLHFTSPAAPVWHWQRVSRPGRDTYRHTLHTYSKAPVYNCINLFKQRISASSATDGRLDG